MARRNGFTLPLHPLQLLGWAAIAVMTVLSYLFVAPSLTATSRLVFLCCYTVAQFTVLTVGCVLTCVDPTDPLVSGGQSTEMQIVCGDCNCSVHSDSKHCMRCNRCVRRFDHHCKWLNNDIGKRNYCAFWVILAAIETSATMQLVFAALTISQEVQEGVEGEEVALSFQCLLAAISVVTLLAVSQLMSFHVYLKWQNLTTYEWIKRRKQKKLQIQPHFTETPKDTVHDIPLRELEGKYKEEKI